METVRPNLVVTAGKNRSPTLVACRVNYNALENHPSFANEVLDRIALAIAKQRGIVLLTGDKALRKAASQEGVSTLGTLGVLDRLLSGNYIDKDEYLTCITSLKQHNGYEVRLPTDELDKRLDNDK